MVMSGESGFFCSCKDLLGTGLVQSLLTGSTGEKVVVSLAARLMERVTGCDVSRGGKIQVGSPRVVAVNQSISESYLEVLKAVSRQNCQTCKQPVAQNACLRNACWQKAADSLIRVSKPCSRDIQGNGLSSEERRELEDLASMQLLVESTTSFVNGRVRVRHKRLRREGQLEPLKKKLAASGLACSWNPRAGSALITYDARWMSREHFYQAALPLARYLRNST